MPRRAAAALRVSVVSVVMGAAIRVQCRQRSLRQKCIGDPPRAAANAARPAAEPLWVALRRHAESEYIANVLPLVSGSPVERWSKPNQARGNSRQCRNAALQG